MHRPPWGVPLAWLIIITTSVATAAQPASSKDVVMRTTEISGSGFTVTLSAAWRTWRAGEAGSLAGIWATDVASRQMCRFSLLEGVASAERAAHETVQAVDANSQHEVVERTFLNVPSGNAVRVAYRFKGAPDDARFVLNEYYLTVPSGVVSVYCAGDEPPADRWLSIVEAIAPLPAEPPAPAPFDPRVEVPDHGLAVDFPAEWLVRSWPGPGPVLGGSLVLRAVTLAQDDGSGGYECLIEEVTALPSLSDVASLDQWRDTLISIAGAQERRTGEPDVTQVDLPSGHTIRADWERWSGLPATAWVFSDGDRHAALLCRSDEPPDDRWRAIAETIEFLPAEEQGVGQLEAGTPAYEPP